MKEIKDIFSTQAATYAGFRPVYPKELYDFIFQHVSNFDAAWDCGTGNGQVANVLSEKFIKVYATDISAKQIEHAVRKNNIVYEVQRAEHTNFADNNFDLITIGTALHWFDFDAFYKEVKRVAKNSAIIVAWAYAPFRSTPAIDAILDNFYFNIIHDYWDAERRYVDDKYLAIPFPFEEIKAPELFINAEWTNEQFIGFLNSWSSVQHYIRKNGTNPVSLIEADIREAWKDGEVITVRFPLFIKAGKILK
jgi:ubiquinone/menaquinone biosynthesis C-methylase UbiE